MSNLFDRLTGGTGGRRDGRGGRRSAGARRGAPQEDQIREGWSLLGDGEEEDDRRDLLGRGAAEGRRRWDGGDEGERGIETIDFLGDGGEGGGIPKGTDMGVA